MNDHPMAKLGLSTNPLLAGTDFQFDMQRVNDLFKHFNCHHFIMMSVWIRLEILKPEVRHTPHVVPRELARIYASVTGSGDSYFRRANGTRDVLLGKYLRWFSPNICDARAAPDRALGLSSTQ
ncbi:hypothetical protein EVAR_49359_1 [Eumeta japonica]|uniref:Uncharacterized protein n=1 Tax=Eumeta variegata TaxID=151549 RepID=A0A4C1XZ39_EUMVA|nr:hypothetical protein EVAR_49359_1 [Eumeta japonica]